MGKRLTRRHLLSTWTLFAASTLAIACNSQAVSVPTAAAGQGSQAKAPTAPAAGQAAPAQAQATPQVQPNPTAGTSAGNIPEVPRSDTLILSVSDSVNEMTDADLFNPFITGAQRTGWQFAFEPLYYYNPWWTKEVSGPAWNPGQEGEIPYLATSYKYNDDFTELVVKLRPNVTWSDGQPFTARDVAFTISMLSDNAPTLTWSNDIKLWVKDVAAQDDLTAKFTLHTPNPRFFFRYFFWRGDAGFPIVPEHVFKGQDATTFTNLALDKGSPVVTGPWNLVLSSPQQKIFDRRDDWWGAKTNFNRLPAMKRIVVLPRYEDSKLSQLFISNQVDTTHNLQNPSDAEVVMAKNPKIQVRTPDKAKPWGWVDFWTNYIGFNTSKPPYDDRDIRWAINHAISRKKIVDIGFKGDTVATVLPFPAFPSMTTYFDAVQDLLQKYPIDSYDPDRTAQIMQQKGYAKDSDGFWAKDGNRFSMIIISISGFFENFVPLITTMLRDAGFDASFKSPTNSGTLVNTGDAEIFLQGYGGSYRDPYVTLDLFHSRYAVANGEVAQEPFRWKNDEYDTLVDQMGKIPATDPKFMSLYHDAMEIWLRELPSLPNVQWYSITPVNTTYWKNWPSAQNPYSSPECWHRGEAGPFINTIEKA